MTPKRCPNCGYMPLIADDFDPDQLSQDFFCPQCGGGMVVYYDDLPDDDPADDDDMPSIQSLIDAGYDIFEDV